MKRTLLSLLIVGTFSGLGPLAMAKDVIDTTNQSSPAKNSTNDARETNPTKGAVAGPSTVQEGTQNQGQGQTDNGVNQTNKQGSAQVGGSPDTNAGNQQGANSAKQTDPASGSKAQTGARADSSAAREKAQAQYKDAKAKCDRMQGETMASCMTDAKAAMEAAIGKTTAPGQQGKAGEKGTETSAQVGGAPDTNPSTQNQINSATQTNPTR